MREVIVIGAGIVGATITETLRRQGRDVLLLDSRDPEAGTGPCGGSVKPSPLTGMDKGELSLALKTLDEAWGLEREMYRVLPSGEPLKHEVWRIDMHDVFTIEKTFATVSKIVDNRIEFYLSKKYELVSEEFGLLIVASGYGTRLLISGFEDILYTRKGVSFLWDGQVEFPYVQTWAPYKQVTVHNYGPKLVWGADGSALKPENWTWERTEQCRERIMEVMCRSDRPLQAKHGLRTFCKNIGDQKRPLYLGQNQKNIWFAVGAGKFGCLAAGWAANQLREVR